MEIENPAFTGTMKWFYYPLMTPCCHSHDGMPSYQLRFGLRYSLQNNSCSDCGHLLRSEDYRFPSWCVTEWIISSVTPSEESTETGRSVRSPPWDAFIPDAPTWPVAMTPILLPLMKHPRGEEVFIDTSAFYAVLDAEDEVHAQARVGWLGLIRDGKPLVTSNYVCVETCVLVQA